MIPSGIIKGIEEDYELRRYLDQSGYGLDWGVFTRVVFNAIARIINRRVSNAVILRPALVDDRLIVGGAELDRLFFKKKFSSTGDFIEYLQGLSPYNVHNWISGKTLQSYWNGGRAKDKKLNVLLTFLGVDFADWERWKIDGPALGQGPASSFRRPGLATGRNNQELIRKYYLGFYFLYYQKTDGSPTLVKAPFTIGLDDQGMPVVETVTEGMKYRSSLVELRDGILYIECENLEFNEKENHVFNVGNATDPEVIFGISSTISVREKRAIGIRNVLVRQWEGFGSGMPFEKELPFFGDRQWLPEERIIVDYFQRQPYNLLHAGYCCTLTELANSK